MRSYIIIVQSIYKKNGWTLNNFFSIRELLCFDGYQCGDLREKISLNKWVEEVKLAQNVKWGWFKGGSLTNSIFECIRIRKRVIPLNRGQFADEKQGVVFQIWITGSLDLDKNRVKTTNFSHFEFGHTFFQTIILVWNWV